MCSSELYHLYDYSGLCAPSVSRAVEKAPGACPSEDPQAFIQIESEHLNQLHLQYFSHWLLLCSLEALTMESKGGRRNIWLQSAQER